MKRFMIVIMRWLNRESNEDKEREIVVLHEKIETFQKGSIVFIAVTIGLLSILPLIYILGHKWS